MILSFGACSPFFWQADSQWVVTRLIPWNLVAPWVIGVICATLLGYGAILTNKLFNEREYHQISSGLPGVAYLIFGAAMLLVSPDPDFLIINLLLLFGFRYQTLVFRQNDVRQESFNSAMLFGMAAMLYYPLAILLVALLVSMAVSRTFILREYTLAIIGFAFPWLWGFALGFVFDFDPIALFITEHEPIHKAVSVAVSPGVVLLAWALIPLLGSFAGSTNIARNTKTVTLFFSTALTLAIIAGELLSNRGSLILIAIPVGLILPYLILQSKSTSRSWLITIIMIAGLLLAAFDSPIV